MRITPETLINIARETAKKRSLSEPDLVAAYLTGSLRTSDPFLGGATDIDLVLVHQLPQKVTREIIPLTPEIHLDIRHNARSDYDRPRELRVHPWLGPELYDALPLYVTEHFFEFVQAGVRDKYHEPTTVVKRARSTLEDARSLWSSLKAGQPVGALHTLAYLKSIQQAANAVALLTGGPLAERRFLLQFPERADAAGQPGMTAVLLSLLGGSRAQMAHLDALIPEWERAFVEASNRSRGSSPIHPARLSYYKLAFEALLAGENSLNMLWPFIITWTLAATFLPRIYQKSWSIAFGHIGLGETSLPERMEGLDHFIDTIDDLLDGFAAH